MCDLPPMFDQVLARDGTLDCHWCGIPTRKVPNGHEGPLARDMATLDHVHPKSRGGSHDIENRVISCYRCNQRKGNGGLGTMPKITEDEFVRLMGTGEL